MSVSDEQVFHAMEVYREELAAWTAEPVESSRWNDNGILRYKHHVMHDLNRKMDYTPGKPIPATRKYRREYVGDAESAKRFIRFEAMKAALLSVES